MLRHGRTYLGRAENGAVTSPRQILSDRACGHQLFNSGSAVQTSLLRTERLRKSKHTGSEYSIWKTYSVFEFSTKKVDLLIIARKYKHLTESSAIEN